MNRRDFIGRTLGVIAGSAVVSKGAVAATPCPPLLDGSSQGVGCGSGTLLGEAAAGLSSGQIVNFEAGWNDKLRLGSTGDIQWCTSLLFYDPVRQQAQMMGKPASGQSLDFAHFIYDEVSSEWTRTTLANLSGTNPNGHMWGQCYDWHTGNYWHHIQNLQRLYFYDNSAGRFRQTQDYENILNPSGAQSTGGLAYHPNLFGTGDGGILINDTAFVNAYRKSNSTWYSIYSKPSGHPARGARGGGDSVYIEAIDSVIFGTGHDGSGSVLPMVRVGAGSNGTPGTVEFIAPPPNNVRSIGSGSTAGRMVVDPNNSNRLLFLAVDSTHRIFESTDYGDSWQDTGRTHPFISEMSGGERLWTCGALPTYGVLWGMCGQSSGVRSILWKPA
jgi:hypothetical protein